MPEYKKILVLRNCKMDFDKEVPIYFNDPLKIAGDATLMLIGKDLFADLVTEISINEYYLEISSLLNRIDSLLLTTKPLNNPIKRKIEDLYSG